MGLFKKKPKKDAAQMVIAQPKKEESTATPVVDVIGKDNTVSCAVLESWYWVVQRACQATENISIVEHPNELPTRNIPTEDQSAGSGTPSTRRRRKKTPGPCTLRLEITDDSGTILDAAHGNSEAFDGLEDKDELVRTMQRCRCENLELSPPSSLINWDVTKEECMNLVGTSMPNLAGDKSEARIAVLKEPMGSRGTGIFFVRTSQEIHAIVEEHRKRVLEESDFLDNLISAKGRIPSWVLQAEVHPCLLIRDRKKFNIRTYVVCVEELETDELVQVYVYNRHEIRVAADSVPEGDSETRDRYAHITNAYNSKGHQHALLHDEPELMKTKLERKIEVFVAEAFSKHFINDIARRVAISARQDEGSSQIIRKFALAGLDLMVTEGGRLYLLEANVNPTAPPAESTDEKFQDHLVEFMRDLMGLVARKHSPNFLSTADLLEQGQYS